MTEILIFAIIFMSIVVIGSIYRAIKGPTAADRLIAINVIGTKTIILILMISLVFKENFFVDVALVYALISFISSIVIANYIEKLGGK
nr:monovalent cation/H+ antiporter complex subunit F [Sedimentibacter sp.]